MELEEDFLKQIRDAYGDRAEKIISAFKFANEKHFGQVRDSGEEYITHPIATAKNIVNLRGDATTVICGFLHDVLGKTETSTSEIADKFGNEVLNILVGFSKIRTIKEAYEKHPEEKDNIIKMLLALSKDTRTIFVKLADRLHNVQTLSVKPLDKQIKIAKETLEIFTPIAERLGMSKFKRELENMCFQIVYPDGYKITQNFLSESFKKREHIIEDVSNELKKIAIEHGISTFRVQSRLKSNYSIFQKMQKKGADSIYDIVAHRVIVQEIKECYEMLGAIHAKWKPIEGRIKDYIACPKKNMYMSLHTTVLYPTDEGAVPFEIQIRTEEMHNFCEYGLAAHWIYKDKGSVKTGNIGNKAMLEKNGDAKPKNDNKEDNAEEFLQIIENGFYPNEIFVFTPKLNVLTLLDGSNAIDVAYAIHSEVGNRCVGAKINDKMVPLDTLVKTADIVELVTSSTCKGPSKDWLKIVKMPSTKEKINAFFKKNMRDENIKKGRAILEQASKAKGVSLPCLLEDKWVSVVLDKLSFKDLDELYASVGHGSMTSAKVINRLYGFYEESKKIEKSVVDKPLLDKKLKETDISGFDGIMTKLAKCCSPVPGDEIVGYISRGRGIVVHRSDCAHIKELEKERFMPLNWGKPATDEKFIAQLVFICKDRAGLFTDISQKISEKNINIRSIRSTNSNNDGQISIYMGIDVKNKEELDDFANKCESIQGVIAVKR